MTRLSFIIPAYNAAHSIGATLESIVALGLGGNEYEVIVVDDCSDDNTVEVVESYCARIPGLTLLKQATNHRQGAARNRALAIAKGTFVSFVDADDLVLPGMVKALEMIEAHDADICFCPMEREIKGRKDIWMLERDEDFCLTGAEVCENIFDPSCTLFLAACGYLIRLSLIKEHKRGFIEDHQGEDSDFTLYYMSRADRICYNTAASYHYIDSPRSTINSRNIAIVKDYMLLAERLVAMAEKEFGDLPIFQAKVKGYVARMCLDRLALWYMGKVKTSAVASLYKEFPAERRYRLAEIKPKFFQRFVLEHRLLASAFLAIYHPLIMLRCKIRNK